MRSAALRPFDRHQRGRCAATFLMVVIVAISPPSAAADTTPVGSEAEVRDRVDRLLATSGVRAVVVAGRAGVERERYASASAAGPHNLKSASKSVVSLLVGIAIDRGELPGVDVPVAGLLPGYRELLERGIGGGRESLPGFRRSCRTHDLGK